VAVFGTPLDKVYPAENKELASKIVDSGGAWVSETPAGGSTHRNSFILRDRIQSGLSAAVIPSSDRCGGRDDAAHPEIRIWIRRLEAFRSYSCPGSYLPRKYVCGVVPSIVRNISMKALTLS